MARLTNTHRDQIRNQLIAGRFDDQYKALDKAEGELAIRVYDDVLGDEKQALYAAPPHWFEWDDHIGARFGHEVGFLTFGDHAKRPFPASIDEVATVYTADHPFTDEYRRIRSQRKDLQQQQRQLTSEIDDVLRSCTTDKQLIETWPQIEQIVKAVVQSHTKKQVPAQRIETLNAKLELQPHDG